MDKTRGGLRRGDGKMRVNLSLDNGLYNYTKMRSRIYLWCSALRGYKTSHFRFLFFSLIFLASFFNPFTYLYPKKKSHHSIRWYSLVENASISRARMPPRAWTNGRLTILLRMNANEDEGWKDFTFGDEE